ncbi:MAG: CARDB domain-containing protein [Natrialbaceae archaeon]|nr:CARDB domain-containing protein [Natrialbaceae archaeon]
MILAGGASDTITLDWATTSGDAGNYTATIQSENDSASTPVSLTAPPELVGISLELADDSLIEGENTTATVTAEYDDGNTVDVTDEAMIASDDSSVASVAGAAVTAESAGSTNITATYEGETDSAPITVLEPGSFAVDISATNATEGETVTVEATVENTGGVEGTQDVSVSIADQSTTETLTLGAGDTATVSLDWLTAPGDAGTYQATAASADDSASTSVTVMEAPDAPYFAVDLTATSPVVEGDTATLTATVTNTGELTDTQARDGVGGRHVDHRVADTGRKRECDGYARVADRNR